MFRNLLVNESGGINQWLMNNQRLYEYILILAFGSSNTVSENQAQSFLVMIKHRDTSGERKLLDILMI